MWIYVKQIWLFVMLLYLILKHKSYIAEVSPTAQLQIYEGRGKSRKALRNDKFCTFSDVPERINCSAIDFKSLGTTKDTKITNFTHHIFF